MSVRLRASRIVVAGLVAACGLLPAPPAAADGSLSTTVCGDPVFTFCLYAADCLYAAEQSVGGPNLGRVRLCRTGVGNCSRASYLA